MDLDGAAPTRQQPEIYTVYARETPFRLYRSQIETDSPNYFTAAFLSHDFAESSSKTLSTDRHPQLFSLIVEHLSGYDILPLEPSVLPRYMSKEVAIKNLRKDADYFGLNSLVQAIDLHLNPPAMPIHFPKSLAKEHETTSILDISRFTTPPSDLKFERVTDLEDFEIHVVGLEGKHLYRHRNVRARLTLQRESDGQQSPLIILKAFPTYSIAETAGDPLRLDSTPMFIDSFHPLSINGNTTTSTVLSSILETGSEVHGRPTWLTALSPQVEPLALMEPDEIWENVDPGTVVPSIELFADELIFSIEVNGCSGGTPNLIETVVCIYEYGSFRTIDKRASEWEQAIKAVDSKP